LHLSRREHFSEVGRLGLVAIVGQLITFAISVALARHLSAEEFEAYVVAAALFLLWLAVAAQGLDKYAMRLLPGKFHRRQWRLAWGYCRFTVVRILVGATVLGVAAALWARYLRDFPPAVLAAVYLSCLVLPLGVAVHFFSAVLSATGDCFRAGVVTLLLVPAVALAMIGVGVALRVEWSGALGIACWGTGWTLALVAVMRWVQRAWFGPRAGLRDRHTPRWRLNSLPFRLFRLAMGVMARIAVVMLDWLQPSATATGAYGAALSMAALVAVATNRVYARELSVLMEHRRRPAATTAPAVAAAGGGAVAAGGLPVYRSATGAIPARVCPRGWSGLSPAGGCQRDHGAAGAGADQPEVPGIEPGHFRGTGRLRAAAAVPVISAGAAL